MRGYRDGLRLGLHLDSPGRVASYIDAVCQASAAKATLLKIAETTAEWRGGEQRVCATNQHCAGSWSAWEWQWEWE
jgi:hypothetical protein